MATRIISMFESIGFSWFTPIIRLLIGENPKEQLMVMLKQIGIPVAAFFAFLFLWHVGAQCVDTSLGKLPGPVQVADRPGHILSADPTTRRQMKSLDRHDMKTSDDRPSRQCQTGHCTLHMTSDRVGG